MALVAIVASTGNHLPKNCLTQDVLRPIFRGILLLVSWRVFLNPYTIQPYDSPTRPPKTNKKITPGHVRSRKEPVH